MPRYEYKVVPAPKKAGKIKGVKGTDQRFAVELARLMNEYGAEGWEYQRADTLPVEERQGLGRRATVSQNMLIFRREVAVVAQAPEPVAMPSFASASPALGTVDPGGQAGNAPRIGAAPSEPGNAPDIAAQ